MSKKLNNSGKNLMAHPEYWQYIATMGKLQLGHDINISTSEVQDFYRTALLIAMSYDLFSGSKKK